MIEKELRILLIDDNLFYSRLLQQILTIPNFILDTVGTLSEAFENVALKNYDIVLLDLGLPDSYGLETFTKFNNRYPDLPIIILTGLDDEEIAEKAIQAGAQDYLVKGTYLIQGEAGKSLIIRAIRYSIDRQQIQAALLRERNLMETRVTQRTTELQEANKVLKRYNERLKILQEFQRTAIASRSSQEISQAAINTCTKLVSLTWAEVLVINSESQKFEVTAHTSVDETPMNEEFLTISSIFPTRTLRAEKLIQEDDLRLCARPSPYEKRLLDKGIISYNLFSMIAEGRIIGALCVGGNKRNAFNSEDLEILQVLNSHLALAIHNARLFEQVNSSSERLHNLATQLVSAQEDERRRISLELHDEAGQALTAIKLNLGLFQESLPVNMNELTERIKEAMKMTDETMDLIRSLAHGLHPPALDAVGLHQAFTDYCQRATRQSGVKIHYSGKDIPHLPDYIKISFYRVLQEALNNIFKHAQASNIEVILGIEREIITLYVHDNGHGFTQAPELAMSQGIGLKGIINRIEALGGYIKIISSQAKGTTLVAKIPWKDTV
jgi:signal transduction histidine kinase